MTKIYVGWFEGSYGSGGYLSNASTNKLALVKYSLEVEGNQNMEIECFDSETTKSLFECSCLTQYSDKNQWCSCPDCKDNDETVRYLVDTHQGNYKK